MNIITIDWLILMASQYIKGYSMPRKDEVRELHSLYVHIYNFFVVVSEEFFFHFLVQGPIKYK